MIPRALKYAMMAGVALALLAPLARGDELRNRKRGEPMPTYKLTTIDGTLASSEDTKGSVVVLVYLSAEQKSSELAAVDSRTVVRGLEGEPVKLVHVTADIVQKAYFQRFRQERALDCPLALDADRTLYGQLGLIVFPTTIVVDKEGKLAHVISIHSPDYSQILGAYVRHALGQLNDAQLQERLQTKSADEGSPKSLASSHRAVARLMREKGKFDTAREELTKARELDPANPEIVLDLADLSLSTGALDEADREVDSVLAQSSANRRAKQIKGIILFRRDKLGDAERMLTEALDLNPEPARVHYYLARVFEKKGDQAKAIEHYREAVKRLLNEQDPGPASSVVGEKK